MRVTKRYQRFIISRREHGSSISFMIEKIGLKKQTGDFRGIRGSLGLILFSEHGAFS